MPIVGAYPSTSVAFEGVGILPLKYGKVSAALHTPDPMVAANISHGGSNGMVAVQFALLRDLGELTGKAFVHCDANKKRVHQVAITFFSIQDLLLFETYPKQMNGVRPGNDIR
ncbi:hypothetical protein FV232_26965 [Methylobacterium sp. WL30]|uniref:hypothetical protein n=1 Tax=unclassified Methylobacterium TaxID=2615210 RepID=UPI0010E53A5C|nr:MULTISPECIES: hypothetical protein [unclassified Methylobacterium]RYF03570.1 MAG: hypothetical protein EOO77_30850 [Oxalobacteraceae bacterium]TXN27647.1 hypothetical protein FV225_21725 [Methylobacterium sp. WL93]TXN49346.1 hypothetical protein FV227_16730 [Methylobacterium sp. WL119]TXN61544.1 hypothetical protein FV232_26965 [Methylobacterium sp. WL30]